MQDKSDLINLLMAMSFLHTYKTLGIEELKLLIRADTYKLSLIIAPYSEGLKPSREIEHILRVLKAHIIAYSELLRKCY